MARPGKRPTPTKILAMRGSWRANTRPHEPQAPPVRPRPPAWLDAQGKKLWRLWMKRLQHAQLITELDEMTFARYCQVHARWLRCEQFLQTHGETYPQRDSAGQVTGFALFPQALYQARLFDQLLRMEQEFGLTPASRVSLVTQKETPAHGNSDEAAQKARFFQFG